MILRKLNGLNVLQSQRLLDLGVMHGWFGTSLGNTMLRETMTAEEVAAVQARWQQACQTLGLNAGKLVKTTGLVQSGIVHVVAASEAGQTIGKADGYVTLAPAVPIVLRAADCMQIAIYDPEARVLALIHAGGEGLANNILANALQVMTECGAHAARVYVAIGPAISPAHFVPTQEVHGFTVDKVQALRPVTMPLKDGRHGYDIVSTAREELARLGVAAENIESSDIDTFASPNFYSWERDRVSQPAAALYRHGLFAAIGPE